MEGLSKTKFIQAIDGQTTSDDFVEELNGLDPSEQKTDKGNKDEDKRDKAAVRREEFLSIYKEDKETGTGDGDDAPDLSNGIRFKKEDEDEESGF